jgi:hypothetical protein
VPTHQQAPLRVLSYGGGTQSAALALMSAAGDLPKLDAAIFADTGGELPETYAYAEYVGRRLEAAGIPFLTVTAGNLEAALRSPVPTSSNPTPPAHVRNPDGSRGRINAYRCSYDYKRLVIQRATRRLCGPPGAWKRAEVEQWLGFSIDEVGRCKPETTCRCGHNRIRPDYRDGGRPRGHRPACTDCACSAFSAWRRNVFPLLDLGYRRGDTIAWFGRHGHPAPPRSACWFCPNSADARWRELASSHPDLFERACSLDEHIRHGGGFNARSGETLRGELFLHSSRIPLRKVSLEADDTPALFDEAELSAACSAGSCFT